MGDNELVAACLQGQGEEFRKIVDSYKGPVMALAMNILGNRQDAEDSCQETFIQVYRNLGRFDPQKSFRNWIFTILYRRCLDQLKKKRRFQSAFNRAKHEAPRGTPPETAGAGRRQLLAKELLVRLSPKERVVLTLWANEGFTAAEISGVLCCSPSTARVYLFNARKKIKTLLEKSHAPF
jgi:RNA polymerase sigma-70 factor (ECF subfamily)